jgi:hypothetical protein
MQKQFDTLTDFKNEFMANTELQEKFRADPLKAIEQITDSSPLGTDKWIYRIIVLSLGITIVSIIIGVILLIGSGSITSDAGVPTILTAIGSAAIGALAGLLAPPPKGR